MTTLDIKPFVFNKSALKSFGMTTLDIKSFITKHLQDLHQKLTRINMTNLALKRFFPWEMPIRPVL